MFRKVSIMALAVFALFLVGCAAQQGGSGGSGGFQSDINAPDWYLNPPQREGAIAVAASARSRQMEIALDRAQLQAKRDLAANIRSTIEGQREQYMEEIGSDAKEAKIRKQYQDFSREMVAQKLQGTRIVEKAIVKEDGAYRAFVLVELTMEDIKKKLSGKEELKTMFNAQQFEKDMDKNLDKLRDRRQQKLSQ